MGAPYIGVMNTNQTVTIATIASEAGVSVTTARLRCDSLTTDHVGNHTPLSPADASMIRAAVRVSLANNA